jgi:hypothetical protein
MSGTEDTHTNSLFPLREIFLDKFETQAVLDRLDKWGVVVINSHFATHADLWMQSLKKWLMSISEGLSEDPVTWDQYNLPYGPRRGMMQSLISHSPTMWQIREAFYPLYAEILGDYELFTSIDGATIHPYIPDDGNDWPHIDQTILDTKCIQGQVVLTDTTASFRCTPGSHIKHKEILQMYGKTNDASNWLKFTPTMSSELIELFQFQYWQVPIHAPKGSVIFWRSNTIHSAKRNDIGDDSWRGVAYVSMRPATEYSNEDKQILSKAAMGGLTTNHWGNKIFDNKPLYAKERSPSITRLSENPELVVLPPKQWTPLMLKLTAQQ